MMSNNFKRISLYIACLFFLFSGFHCTNVEKGRPQIALIPYPSELVEGEGNFTVYPETVINEPASGLFTGETQLLSELFTNSFGKPLALQKDPDSAAIQLIEDPQISSDEGYHIVINKDRVVLSAATPAGMFRAVQTIRQLLPVSIEQKNNQPQKGLKLPVITIKDHPAYSWRGIHLDVSRHFFSMDYLKKLVDLMALYKMNKFHLHLTDDQGWRMEIKKYPKLTEEGAWRTFNKQDSACMERAKDNPDFIIDTSHIIHKNGKTLYGGFYTQEQMKDFVAYATARHIDIIPEVDMPGHMMAAINSYMYLSCDNTSTFGQFFSTPICPCNPATLEFAKDIYSEIMDIFPYEYIHIGGDEVERSHWERSPSCQAMMQKNGMKTTAELQSWFIREMEKFFHSKGKKLIGWDEILEGGVSKTAAIMYWRTWVPKAPVEAARNGNKVIMAPNSPLYFSQQPDKNSLPAVYQYELIPKELSGEEAKNIIGSEACMWSESIPTEQRADYLYMPRLTALSERLWSDKSDYDSYTQRLKVQFRRLDALNVSYRIPDLPLLDNYAFTDNFELSIPKPIDDLDIYYTTDGTVPTQGSTLLNDKLVVKKSQYVRIAAFKKNGRRGDIYDIDFRKEELAKSIAITDPKKGLMAVLYKKAFDSTILISGNPDSEFNVKNIAVPSEAEAPAFTLQYGGYIQVPADGVYTFYLTSDDASVLKIAGREVVNNDGMHAPKEKNGQVALAKGLHSVDLDFIEGGGGYTLKLKYSFNGSDPKDIPAEWLKH